MKHLLARLTLALFAVLVAGSASAHRLGESYVYFQVSDEALTGRFEVPGLELDRALDIDTDDNFEISGEEVQASADRIFAFFAERLSLSHEGRALALSQGEAAVLGTANGPFVTIGFRVEGLEQVPQTLTIAYRPLADVLDPSHLGYALIESNTRLGIEGNEAHIALAFRPGAEAQTLYLAGEPWGKVFKDFVIHGVWHIWLGFDHVVFLLTLLLPSVMLASAGRWVPEEDFRTALWNVAKIVTVFTLSHSLTLSLAALGIITLPVSFVEAVIAASIVAVAILNMFPSAHRYVLGIVFGFGLFHGFGFANVLEPLGVDPTQKIVGLAAFNIGVELGQLAIVAVAFPVLWLFRRWSLYPPLAFRLGTVGLVLLAGVWFLERTTGFEWNMRATIQAVTGIFT